MVILFNIKFDIAATTINRFRDFIIVCRPQKAFTGILIMLNSPYFRVGGIFPLIKNLKLSVVNIRDNIFNLEKISIECSKIKAKSFNNAAV